MKKIVKILFPEQIKKLLRKAEDFVLRLRYGFTKPVILKDKFGISFVLYPDQTAPIRWLLERGAYKKENAAMDQLVKVGGVAFDIGSHIGIVACYLANKVGESGKVYAFEPFPDSYRKLKENISVNGYKNIRANQIAMSDTAGTSNFYYEPNNHELNSLGQVNGEQGKLTKTVSVETSTIDEFCAKESIQKINFLKIDTEGYEHTVLKGAEKMLTAQRVDIIQFEVSKGPLESLGRNADEIVNYLKSKNYKTYEFFENTKTFKEITTIVAGYDNYYAAHTDLTRYDFKN